MDIYTIGNKYGSLIIDSGQKPTIGLQPFAEYFSSLSGCIFMPNEKRFYIYNRSLRIMILRDVRYLYSITLK